MKLPFKLQAKTKSFLMLIVLFVSIEGLFAQQPHSPYWVSSFSGRLKAASGNKDIFLSPSLEEFRFHVDILRSLSEKTMIGLGLSAELENSYEYGSIGPAFRYFPFTYEHKFSPFIELSPRLGWNRNRYFVPIGCNTCNQEEIYFGSFFYPIAGIGAAFRPEKSRATLEVKTMYLPSYDAGPQYQTAGNIIRTQVRFSFWIQPNAYTR